jgi:hypothetical protein
MGDVSALYGAFSLVATSLLFTGLRGGVLLDNHLINGIFRERDKDKPF